jgi:hypothetical protein
MLLNKRTINLFAIILLWSTVFFIHAACADGDFDYSVFKSPDGVIKVLDLYTDKSFDAYLVERFHYHISDYKTAINALFSDYKSEISKTDACYKVMKDVEINYNNGWVDDLTAFAGRDYVLEHIGALQNLIFNMNRKNVSLFCRDNEKEVIFAELHYFLNFRDFLNHYLAYVKTLSEKQKKSCEKIIKVTESIIESMDEPPMQTILYGNRIGSYLSVLHNVDLEPEIAGYLLGHPAFLGPFDLMQAIEDLRALQATK